MSDLAVPRGYTAVVATYGDPQIAIGADGKWTVDAKWESDNMVLLRDLPMVPKLYVHKMIAEPLREALAACEALGDGYALKTIGCFNPRAQRGSTLVTSLHTFGVAVDINADVNPLIAPCAGDDPRRQDRSAWDLPDAWVAAFQAAGFFWGGAFSTRFDPQHFQLATGC